LLLLNEKSTGLAQLTIEPVLAKVLNSSSFKLVKPLDALSNSLVSPLFYGIQSTVLSNQQGLVTLSGVHVNQNLPGKWTLQCGVDGAMMETPVNICSPNFVRYFLNIDIDEFFFFRSF
jgi:hypothetical protein